MKIVTFVGARPQFVKAAMVSRAILFQQYEYPSTRLATAMWKRDTWRDDRPYAD